jgi:transglutaminase-like putative cysteine protease
MTFDQALRLTSILLASASFIGLALGASLPEWLTLVTGFALILVLLRTLRISSIERLATHAPLSAVTWNILGIIGFLGFWVDMMWISGDLLHAGVHFLLILMVIKLFNLQLRRDYLHLYAISLMAILASASVTTDLWYLPIFLAYLLTGVWTLILFQLTKKSEDAPGPAAVSFIRQGPPESSSRVTPQLFWLGNGLASAAFVLTIVIFFAIPRVSVGLYQKGFGENIRTSGFSDTVNLGAIGPIKRDPSVVMRVELTDGIAQAAGRFYVRGMAFDRYDGRSWTNQLNFRRVLGEYTPGTFTVRQNRLSPPSHLAPTFRQNILLESLDTPVLFAAPFAETVSGRFPTVQSDPTGALYLPFPSSSRIEYSVISRSNPVLPADFEPHAVSYPESFSRHYLQLPLQSERITALAREIAETKRTTYEKVIAIQEHLTRNFRYSLDAPLAEQSHPLEEFLFNRKTGYCEHYATAMVIMLRTIGIPARLVTGFLTSEWNEYGNYYLVRQQDAHAWVEAHLPHSGWVMMDPTPANAEGAASLASPWQVLGRIMDNLRLRWSRFFVEYSADDQLAVVRELKAGGASVRNRAVDSLATILTPVTLMVERAAQYVSRGNLRQLGGFLGLILMGIGALIWLAWKRPWSMRFSAKREPRDEQMMTRLYERMLRHLARRGISKPRAMPPLQFIRFIQAQWSEAGSAVATITELYCRARFGQIHLTHEQLQSAEDRFRQLIAMDRP